MKLTADVDFGLMRSEAQAEILFKGMTTALKVRAMVSRSLEAQVSSILRVCIVGYLHAVDL